ncbi:lysophospholipid acyltransferase LPEAT1 isoform X1 [Iris pallida]|nr:lysophospholipid acyltransferase LPEAT1 isoform X1 [Iris pallida]
MSSELKPLADTNGSLDPSSAGGAAAENDGRPLLKPDPPAAPAESIQEMERKYAAYVRNDAYGTMGRGELPATEKALLGLALVALVPIRLVSATLVLVLYYLICRLCTLFSAPNREDGQEDYAHMVGWRRKAVVRSGRFLGRVMLFCFGFYWIRETRRGFSDEV